jgi:hypothetical protein
MTYPSDPTPNYGTNPPPPPTTMPTYPPAQPYPPPQPYAPPVYVPPQWSQATPTLNYQITDRVEKGVNQFALMSLILGVASIPFMCSGFVTGGWPILTGLLGLGSAALGHVGLVQTPPAGKSRNNGLAITGLVFGYLAIAISIVWILLKLKYDNSGSTTVTTQ